MPALKRIGAAALSAFGFGQGGAATVTANYLIVAGGGGGGSFEGGGGGAGGYQANTTSLSLTTSYTVVIGAGGTAGAAVTDATSRGGLGSNSSITGLTASVGGGGGSPGWTAIYPATSGGSGGGGSAGATTGGSGTSGQGNSGGAGATNSSTYFVGGGGGGASAAGSAGTSGGGGAGGAGTASSISGASVTYAGGGGGSYYTTGTAGAGGAGGGGAGGSSSVGTNGTANLGGGGGGGFNGGTNYAGGQGGSGIVIISYTGVQQFGGGVVTSAAGNTIHTFYTSGVLSPLSSLSASYLIVAGGGGGNGGGGGAGGFLTGSGTTIDINSTYVVTVGAGGAAVTSGSNSSFSIVATTAVGGGRGGGVSGGSGGGADNGSPTAFGSGTTGQGNNGGQGTSAVAASGGGGGAGAVGANSTSGAGGAGGTGNASTITGTSVYYAGGGGGGGTTSGGAGGNGGGGAGGTSSAVAGTANTGGGGGGIFTAGQAAGGSGIVVIAYAGSTQQMSGGTVTVSGGNVIHTFTSSGYLSPLTNFGNSLRFRSSASANLTRTPTATGNRQKWTWSAWVKRGQIGSVQSFLFGSNVNSSAGIGMGFAQGNNYDTIGYTVNGVGVANTTAVFRDPAAWYHIVFVLDSTQATAANRFMVYVNNVNYPFSSSLITQNNNYDVNATTAHYIATINGGGNYFDGEMTNINFIDGQALTPSSFGSYNQYGNWVPVTYGGSYGTNGFFLPFNSGYGVSTYTGVFSGSNYLTTNYSVNWSTYGNFTLECWVYATGYSATVSAIGGTSVAAADGYSFLYLYNTGKIAWGINGTNEFASSTGVVSSNTWTHIAAVRNGSNLNIYVNGQSVASTSSASTYLSNNSRGLVVSGGVTADNFIGSISNFRFANSAVYTANFVPPAAPLTAISGTQLLTLQNNTIVDNSGNSVTITNNGTVTTANATPFANPYTLTTDQSPQGNNWTPSGISTTAGSTYDSMTDVPTLSNATSSNYCVGNPLITFGGGSWSDGNLNASIADGSNYARLYGSMGMSSGKWYWEFTQTNTGPTMLGIASSFRPATNAGTFGYYSDEYAYYATGQTYNNGSLVSYGSSYTTGDVIGVALDLTANTLTFYKNGTSQGTAFSSIPAGTWFSGCGCAAGTATGTFNWGQQPFKYTPPSGFVALNAFNM